MYNWVIWGLWASFQANALSRPPEPTMRRFILQRYFFYLYLPYRDVIEMSSEHILGIMSLRRFLLVLMVCSVAAPIASAQDAPMLQKVLGKLAHYSAEYPQEKVYLHLDKPYYGVGDDIWFKGYVTIGAYNQLSGLSKILYVDLVGPGDHAVQSIRLPLIAGVTISDFRLTDSLDEGNYRIRAYTNWMRNFE